MTAALPNPAPPSLTTFAPRVFAPQGGAAPPVLGGQDYEDGCGPVGCPIFFERVVDGVRQIYTIVPGDAEASLITSGDFSEYGVSVSPVGTRRYSDSLISR